MRFRINRIKVPSVVVFREFVLQIVILDHEIVSTLICYRLLPLFYQRTVKYILNVMSITSRGEHCVVASKTSENNKTTYTLTIFNAIGMDGINDEIRLSQIVLVTISLIFINIYLKIISS